MEFALRDSLLPAHIITWLSAFFSTRSAGVL